jgi:hypothetical protein
VNLYHKKNEKDSEKKFETWVWDQMYKNLLIYFKNCIKQFYNNNYFTKFFRKLALKNENSFSIENYSDFLSLERK